MHTTIIISTNTTVDIQEVKLEKKNTILGMDNGENSPYGIFLVD